MRVVVLGAGFGGLELTSRLSEEFGDDVDVTLIDKGDGFVFGFSKLDVMFGRLHADAVLPPVRRHRQAGRAVRPGRRSRAIDPEAERVETDAGTFEARRARRRARRRPATRRRRPGLVEGGHEFYTVAGAFALRDVLADVRGRPGRSSG